MPHFFSKNRINPYIEVVVNGFPPTNKGCMLNIRLNFSSLIYDDTSEYKYLAAVGVTFLFLMYLRKQLRSLNFFTKKNEPNLLSYLDLVALGTVCDVVELKKYNRFFVKKGLELINKRFHRGISKLIDNSKINSFE